MHRDVIGVAAIGGTTLLLTFEGGQQRILDVARITRFTGVFEPLKDERVFRQVRVNGEIGTIFWPNGADLCPDVLFAESTPVSDPSDSAAPVESHRGEDEIGA